MRRQLPVVAILALVLALLTMAACATLPVPVLVPAPTQIRLPSTPCATCAPTTQVAALTQANINARALQAQETATADIQIAQALATSNAGTATQGAALAEAQINTIALQAQAAATADILRAHALATFNAANSTQGAALTQDSLNFSALQAEAAGTANVLRAEALATFNSASSTQSSALTQAAVAQTQVQLGLRLAAQFATQSAAATGTQQWIGALVAGTATTLAQAKTLQAQSAATIAQRTADQRQEQSREPIAFLWKWGLPIFILAVAVLGLWGFGRWLKMYTTGPRTVGQTVGGPLIVWERGRSLAGYLPSMLRWMAWFVETKSSGAVPAGPVHGVVVIDSKLAGTQTATEPMPPRDQELEVVTPTVPGVNGVETEAPPTRTKVRFSKE